MDNKLQVAIEDYKNGIGLYPSAEKNKIGWKRLNQALLNLGIKRTDNEAKRLSKSAAVINDNILDELTPKALYWIGFLYADGSIEKDRPRITLSLTVQDETHLRKFADFFGTGLKVSIYKGRNDADRGYNNCQDAAIVKFSSVKIYERLKELGFTHAKSEDADPHELLKNSRDFWRGVVDGDGWFTMTDKSRGVGLSGTSKTLREFVAFLNDNGIVTKQNPCKDKRRNVYSLDFHSNRTLMPTVNLLYKDATVYLDRKYEIYQNWIENQ